MSLALKLKELEISKAQQNIIHSEIRSITVEEHYCKKTSLINYFSNILRRNIPSNTKPKSEDDTSC